MLKPITVSRLALLTACSLTIALPQTLDASGPEEEATSTAYINGLWFDGEQFVAARKVAVRGVFIGDNAPADTTVDLQGAHVIPPFGDAHTHQFDGTFGFDGQNAGQLAAGTFYAMTMTAPTSGVAQVRHRFDDWDTVDVATSLGGLTGPQSHPADVYEALALRIYGFDQQIERQDEIRASTRMRGNAYWVVEDEETLAQAWAELLRAHPDHIKVFLRHSAEYADRRTDNWAIGGVDPALLPAIAERAKAAGIRLAVATSDLSDFRAALDVEAEIITHLPCYQDTSEPGIYYYADTDAKCLLSAEDAERAAELGTAITLISSEFGKEQTPHVRRRLEANVTLLREAGAHFVIGSNAYGAAVAEGVIAEAKRGLFSMAELLRIGTMNSPRLAFPERHLGCVEAGCEASFVVLGANPIEDPAALGDITMLVKRGRVLELAE